MNIVCLDMEGVLVPEIWIALSDGRDRMRALVTRDSLTPDQIRELIDFAIANNGITRARQTIQTLAQTAAQTLTAAFPDSPARTNLLALLTHILARHK